jgi:hypothetical protein
MRRQRFAMLIWPTIRREWPLIESPGRLLPQWIRMRNRTAATLPIRLLIVRRESEFRGSHRRKDIFTTDL